MVFKPNKLKITDNESIKLKLDLYENGHIGLTFLLSRMKINVQMGAIMTLANFWQLD